MRKIELAMLDAITNKRDWHNTNTRVVRFSGHSEIYLHDNLIAEAPDNEPIQPNYGMFAAYPTATTRSRLRALGVDACIRNFTAYINGQPA